MIVAIQRALTQMLSKDFIWVLLRAVGLTLLLYVLLFFGLQWALDAVPTLRWDWANKAVEIVATLGFVVSAILLLAVVTSLFIGFFLEDVAKAVESKYYRDSAPSRQQSFLEGLWTALRFTGALILFNLLALPLYFVPIVSLFVFFILNGYLLGREYFEIVAYRHLAPKDARGLRRSKAFSVFLAGLVISVAMIIPVFNLVAPLFGTAFMVHIFKRFEDGPMS